MQHLWGLKAGHLPNLGTPLLRHDSLPFSPSHLSACSPRLAAALRCRSLRVVGAAGWLAVPGATCCASRRSRLVPIPSLKQGLNFARNSPVFFYDRVGWLQLLAGCYGQDSSKGQLQDDRPAAAEEFAASVTPTTVWTPTCVFSSAGWSLGASVTALRLALNTPSPMLTLADEDPEKKNNGDSTRTLH